MYPVAILAGGLGTRLGSLTNGQPKALVDVDGKPFIVRLLDLLRDNGADRIVICAGYGGKHLQSMLPDVEFAFDGPTLLGTGGAIHQALDILGERFFVVYGDAYPLVSLAWVQAAFDASNCPALMTVQRVGLSRNRPNAEVRAGRVTSYDKYSGERFRYFDYGVEVFSRSTIVASPTPFDLSLIHQHLIDRGQLAALEVDEPVYEVGSVEGLAEFRDYVGAWVPA